MIQRIIMIAAAAASLAACASANKTIAFDAAAVGPAEGRALVPVTQQPPGFMPMRASRAGFAMAGAFVMIAEGKTFAQENGIVNPATAIEDRLTAGMRERYGYRAGERLDMTGAVDGAPYPTAPGALYVDVKTTNWGFSYLPTNWARYRVNYMSVFQLVDGATNTVVGQYVCNKTSHPDGATAPSLEALLANGSALMNSTFAELANACAGEFNAAVLQQAPAA
ncbi:MAG: hypothetical protein EON85_09960 [Brevundimonas sp.]|nr:MAG: hypothetical protein EON85_09960 [Brevundimonas sp.]